MGLEQQKGEKLLFRIPLKELVKTTSRCLMLPIMPVTCPQSAASTHVPGQLLAPGMIFTGVHVPLREPPPAYNSAFSCNDGKLNLTYGHSWMCGCGAHQLMTVLSSPHFLTGRSAVLSRFPSSFQKGSVPEGHQVTWRSGGGAQEHLC